MNENFVRLKLGIATDIDMRPSEKYVLTPFPEKYFVDVKTRTKKFHTRTLEMVKQFHSKKIDIYISVFLM